MLSCFLPRTVLAGLPEHAYRSMVASIKATCSAFRNAQQAIRVPCKVIVLLTGASPVVPACGEDIVWIFDADHQSVGLDGLLREVSASLKPGDRLCKKSRK